jgi:flagellar basal-body rod protein FlgF
MDAMSVAVASGMRSRTEALDLLANNIANANTAGFKADREFYNLYVSPEAAGSGGYEPATLPVVERNWTDFSPGTLAATGNPLDLALDGRGFFVVRNSSADVLYTRNGNFRVSSTGTLQTQDGYEVRDVTGKSIALDPRKDVTVSADGTILQDGIKVAQIQIADVESTSDLSKTGATYFRIADPDKLVKAYTATRVQQGRLEMANSAPAEHAVRLVSIMRQFEMLQKAMSIGAEMGRKSIEEVARVNG